MDDAGRTPNVRRMQFLDEDAKGAILGGALTVLADVGMVVQHPEAQALLTKAGCRVDRDGLALVPEHLVRHALASAPPS